MIEQVGLSESESGLKFLVNEIVSFACVLMTNKQRMAQVHSIWLKVTDWKNSFNLSFSCLTYLFAEED